MSRTFDILMFSFLISLTVQINISLICVKMHDRYERKSPVAQPRSTSPIPRKLTYSSTNPGRSPAKFNTLNDEDINMRKCKSILSHADLDILLS